MSDLLEVKIDGETIYFEARKQYGSEPTGPLDRLPEKAADAFERAKTVAVNIAKSMNHAIRAMDDEDAPDEFNLEFGLTFTMKGNVVVEVGGDANLKVQMTYKRREQSANHKKKSS